MAAPAPSRRVPKKVRPPPKHGVTDEVLEDTFNKLAKAIQQIQRKNVSKLSFEEHYRYGYNLCLHRKHKKVYDGVSDLVVSHLQTEAKERVEPAFPTSSLLTSAATSTANPAAVPIATSSSRTHIDNATGSGSTGGLGQGRVAQAMEGETFLNAMKATWQDHKVGMGKIRDILKYLDKTYTEPEKKAPVYTLGLHLFLVHLLRHPTIAIQQTLADVTLAMIKIERDGEIINRGLLRTMTDMMCELREVSNDDRQGEGEPIYKSWWEDKFVESTREYYTLWTEVNIERLSAPEFVERVERRLREEEDRVQQYLHPTTEPLLFSLLDHELVARHLQAIVDHPNSGLATLLAEDRYTDLSRIYRLFSRVGDGHAVLMRGLRTWLVGQGQRIVDDLAAAQAAPAKAAGRPADEQDVADMEQEAGIAALPPGKEDRKGKGREVDSTNAAKTTASTAPAAAGSALRATQNALEWVNTVLRLRGKMDAILAQAFEKNKLFQNAVNDAFVTFVNQVHKSPEYISIYLDDNLKKGLKGKNESEVDDVLDKTVMLFRYLHDKDRFEDYYKRHLAKRLLSGTSVSDDAERGMLQKLKLECGSSFVSKLEGMIKDVTGSEDLNKGYKTYIENLGASRPTKTELSVKVCTASFWPSHTLQPCQLPTELVKITKSFENYFNQKHSGRRLNWHAEHGTVDVRVRFDKAPKDINVATHGFVVLSAFEDLDKGQSLNYEHLAAHTGLSEANLKRTLQSLACAKYKILLKEPAGKNIANTDQFAFNHGFTNTAARIKIATILNRVENVEEAKQTDSRVEAERSQVIDAAIVRAMKSRKQLSHSDLINETTSLLSRRFVPRTASIKLAIERLIEKDYIERDAVDKKMLIYKA